MANKSFFEHNDYTTVMFLSIMVISLIVLFGFVDFVEGVNRGFTAYAIKEQNLSSTQPLGLNNSSETEMGEVYTTQAWSIFYIITLVVIIFIAVLFFILKKTVQKNIEEEDKSGGFIE